MGSGKNGTFDVHPDLNQWAILFTAEDSLTKAPGFIYSYLKFFNCSVKEFLLQPLEGHGLWDKKKVFGELNKKAADDEPLAILTRATIRIQRLKNFWKNVAAPASGMAAAEGLLLSYGIGEVPWIKQATFSIWQNKNLMRQYAYSTEQHAAVIRKTRKENWYSEEMFVRFRIVNVTGLPETLTAKMLILQPSYEEA